MCVILLFLKSLKARLAVLRASVQRPDQDGLAVRLLVLPEVLGIELPAAFSILFVMSFRNEFTDVLSNSSILCSFNKVLYSDQSAFSNINFLGSFISSISGEKFSVVKCVDWDPVFKIIKH